MPYVYKHTRLDTNTPFYIGIGNVINLTLLSDYKGEMLTSPNQLQSKT